MPRMRESAEVLVSATILISVQQSTGCLCFFEEIAQNLQNQHALRFMGFETEFNVGIPDRITAEHNLVLEQNDLVVSAMTAFVHQVKHRAGSMMYHYASWPGKLAVGASPIEADRDKCVADLHRDFKMSQRPGCRSEKTICCKDDQEQSVQPHCDEGSCISSIWAT